MSYHCSFVEPLTYGHTGGSFGVVYKAIDKSTGELVAIKHVGTALVQTCVNFLSSA